MRLCEIEREKTRAKMEAFNKPTKRPSEMEHPDMKDAKRSYLSPSLTTQEEKARKSSTHQIAVKCAEKTHPVDNNGAAGVQNIDQTGVKATDLSLPAAENSTEVDANVTPPSMNMLPLPGNLLPSYHLANTGFRATLGSMSINPGLTSAPSLTPGDHLTIVKSGEVDLLGDKDSVIKLTTDTKHRILNMIRDGLALGSPSDPFGQQVAAIFGNLLASVTEAERRLKDLYDLNPDLY